MLSFECQITETAFLSTDLSTYVMKVQMNEKSNNLNVVYIFELGTNLLKLWKDRWAVKEIPGQQLGQNGPFETQTQCSNSWGYQGV